MLPQLALRRRVNDQSPCAIHADTQGRRTLALHASPVDTSAANHYIVYDSENALAANPLARFTLYLAVVEHSSLIELHASTMYRSGERDLIRMKIFPARSADHIRWRVTQNVGDRV